MLFLFFRRFSKHVFICITIVCALGAYSLSPIKMQSGAVGGKQLQEASSHQELAAFFPRQTLFYASFKSDFQAQADINQDQALSSNLDTSQVLKSLLRSINVGGLSLPGLQNEDEKALLSQVQTLAIGLLDISLGKLQSMKKAQPEEERSILRSLLVCEHPQLEALESLFDRAFQTSHPAVVKQEQAKKAQLFQVKINQPSIAKTTRNIFFPFFAAPRLWFAFYDNNWLLVASQKADVLDAIERLERKRSESAPFEESLSAKVSFNRHLKESSEEINAFDGAQPDLLENDLFCYCNLQEIIKLASIEARIEKALRALELERLQALAFRCAWSWKTQDNPARLWARLSCRKGYGLPAWFIPFQSSEEQSWTAPALLQDFAPPSSFVTFETRYTALEARGKELLDSLYSQAGELFELLYVIDLVKSEDRLWQFFNDSEMRTKIQRAWEEVATLCGDQQLLCFMPVAQDSAKPSSEEKKEADSATPKTFGFLSVALRLDDEEKNSSDDQLRARLQTVLFGGQPQVHKEGSSASEDLSELGISEQRLEAGFTLVSSAESSLSFAFNRQFLLIGSEEALRAALVAYENRPQASNSGQSLDFKGDLRGRISLAGFFENLGPTSNIGQRFSRSLQKIGVSSDSFAEPDENQEKLTGFFTRLLASTFHSLVFEADCDQAGLSLRGSCIPVVGGPEKLFALLQKDQAEQEVKGIQERFEKVYAAILYFQLLDPKDALPARLEDLVEAGVLRAEDLYSPSQRSNNEKEQAEKAFIYYAPKNHVLEASEQNKLLLYQAKPLFESGQFMVLFQNGESALVDEAELKLLLEVSDS